jgi:hypothetical protein
VREVLNASLAVAGRGACEKLAQFKVLGIDCSQTPWLHKMTCCRDLKLQVTVFGINKTGSGCKQLA